MTSADTSSSKPDHRLAELAAAAVGDVESRPVWVWSGNGSSLIWANSAGLATFGADSLEAAAELEISPTKPASRSLVAVARTPVGAGGRGRVEILRIATAHHQETLVATCKPIALGDDVAVMAVASGPTRANRTVPVAQLRPAKVEADPVQEPVVSEEPVSEAPETIPQVTEVGEQGATDDFTLSIVDDVPDRVDEADDPTPSPFIFKPRSRPHRFSFVVTREGKVRSLSSGLADAVGRSNSLQDGDIASESIERLGRDVPPAVRNAIAERHRFAEHSVLWPVSDHNVDVPVRLSGFDEDDGELRVFGTVLTGHAQDRTALSNEQPSRLVETSLDDDIEPTDLSTVPEAAGQNSTDEPVPMAAQMPGGAALVAAAGAMAAGIARAMSASADSSDAEESIAPGTDGVLGTVLDEEDARTAGLWTDEPAATLLASADDQAEPAETDPAATAYDASTWAAAAGAVTARPPVAAPALDADDGPATTSEPIVALRDALEDGEARTAGLWSDEPVSEEPSRPGEPVPAPNDGPDAATLAAAAGAIAAGIAGAMQSPSNEAASSEPAPTVPITALSDSLEQSEALTAGLWTDQDPVAVSAPVELSAEPIEADIVSPLDDTLTDVDAETAGLWSSVTSGSPDEEQTEADRRDIPESTRKAMAAVAAGLAAGLAAGPIRQASSSEDGQSDEVPVFAPSDAPVTPDDGLSRPERLTFQEIARRLGARITGHEDEEDLLGDDGARDASSPSADVVALGRGEDGAAQDVESEDGDEGDERPAGGQVLAFTRTEPNAERMVLDRLPLGIIIYHERTILYANRAALEISGRPSLDALKDHDGIESLFAQGSDDLDNDDGSMILMRPDGSRISVAGRLQSVRWDGQAAAMLSIREQGPLDGAQAEQAHDAALTSAAAVATADALPLVRARIGELEAIVDLASDGVVTLDADGEIKDLNQAAQALVGYTADDLIGRPFRLLFAEDSRQQALDYLDDIAQQGHLSLFNEGREVECLTAQGDLVPVLMTLGRLTDDQPPAFCAVLRDLSPFKQAETDLVAARRAAEEASAHKSDFLARVSHEIRTPLNAVIGFSEVMLEERFGPVGSERYRQYLRDIHTSGEHLMSLLNDLLDLSKIEAGKMELSFGEVDLNDVVKQCLAIMQPQANQGRIIVRTSLPLSVPKVVADIRSVRQIALNLMSNAIKFTDPGGQIIVSTLYEPSGEVSLRVRDTGRGMDAADVELALEPFRQVPTTLNQVITGTGLGLPLTKALVEANRAQFGLDSTPGEGTLAKVTFPLQRVLAE